MDEIIILFVRQNILFLSVINLLRYDKIILIDSINNYLFT